MPKLLTDKKNILITGGAGFIGSHLAEELIKKANIICLDNFISGSESNIDYLLSYPNFIFLKHDLTKPINLNEQPELGRFKVKYQGVQEVYHLACPTSPKEFNNKRIETALANSHATANALDIAVKYKAKFLHFSSVVVYGPRSKDRLWANEEDLGLVNILSPRACYDEGKRFAETLVNTFRKVHQLDTKIMRLFRTYGPRLKLNDGHMLSDFIDASLNNRDLVINGDESFSSSLCYVSDAVNAAVNLMNSEFGGPYNVGSDQDVKLVDVAKKVLELTGSQSKVVFKEPLEFLSPLMLPKIEAVKKDLGWFPIVRLEDGLKKTIDYLRAQKGLLGVSQNYDSNNEAPDRSSGTGI